MKNLLHNILIASVVLSLNCAPVIAAAMPEPVPAGQTDKQKAAAKKKKEQEKAKAAKAKEKEKAAKAKEKEKAAKAKEKEKAAKAKEKEKETADRQKANEKMQAQREKEAAERAKVAEQRQEAAAKREAAEKEKEEKALRDYEKYQESLENPKTEVISLFNLGLRAGYSAMMDKIQPGADGSLWGSGTLNQSNALQQLKGGGGAGLDISYNLEYGHLLFLTGIDFRFLNSTSVYGFQVDRLETTYNAHYNYLFDKLSEQRNMMQLGVPVMLGAQFGSFYFLAGAKVGYTIWGNYGQKGKYDIIVRDPALLEPYGRGIHEISGETEQPIVFRQPEVSVVAELGLDLDNWLQAQPDPKKKTKVKPGQRLPFGSEHVHYRVGLFAEYGVLNTNATPQADPVLFAQNNEAVQKTNTMLAMNGDTKLNNLFVGAKFTIQFEVPGKQARPVPPPPCYAIYSVVDANTKEPLQMAFMEVVASETGKVAMKEKQIGPKGIKQKHGVGAFKATAKADGYYPTEQTFEIEKVGNTEYVTIAMRPRPVFRVRVYNAETGQVVPATVQILKNDTVSAYNLSTDSVNGSAQQRLEEGPQYKLHIAQMGYDTVNMVIANIGDSMNVALSPIKKGEVFIVKNLHFATNKTRILSTSEEALNDLYMYLARNPQVRIKIIGHTDNVGKDAANQKLSDGRATAVMKDLIERGIDPSRIEAEGRGETQPIDTNDTEEGRQNNRRVEIEIL
jgi:outer membrane protein OmpA-like peptidoglycan-associated protein